MGKPSAAYFLACAVLFGAPVAAVPAEAAIQPGKVMIFKNWVAGCDNSRSCQALPLGNPDGSGNQMPLVLTRSGDSAGAITIGIADADTKSDRYRLLIDNRVVDTGPILAGEVQVQIRGKDAVRLARSMVRGSVLKLVDGYGVTLGQSSLSGYAAAMRLVDVTQKRNGSASAIVARGTKALRIASPVIPVITTKKIVPTDQIPDATSLVALAENSSCAGERLDVTQDTAYSLGESGGIPRALALISCGSGAYNFSSVIFVGSKDVKGKWNFQPAKFDYGQDVKNAAGDQQVLVNSGWDSATQSINSYSKSRSIGDCGRAETYVWDGSMFRLTRATIMEPCRGASDWITIWRADVMLIN
jgi:Protein of unknown function (DUF1176)